ncbi:MtrAB system histidine kinase MtrB [Cellulomonas marina]|uniref:Sensor histidine kinase MtrB n=1 Tax=Cellulomonas marina TaxID=988821 RepID=A0A1I0V059_9CELL|nr:MtrAB system histidine kinase MtrB [Cellulomonas marina]GIG28233.1 two-component sensor histidine kinase [Cellulomonas marina]SFA69698.1 two-component system, OmpR family, sensor histidine kinase MtrB [Cellulomonas marina]
MALRLLRLRTGRRLQAAARRWRTSLQVRVIASTMVIGVLVLALVAAYVGLRMRDGLFDARVTQVLQEAARSTRQAQGTFDSSTATTGADVQTLLYDVSSAQRTGGATPREVFLLRAPGQSSPVRVGAVASDATLVGLVSPALRESVTDGAQHWQSVALPVAGGGTEPAVVVGQPVDVPVVGQYQLFFLYSLQAEQERLDLLWRTLALAGVALAGLLGAITWLVTRQTVHPVRQAAAVAERLADGHLTERLPVRGEDEMATLARAFNEMAGSLQDQIARLEELGAVQRRFVSDVSHELRTPLTTIRIAGEMIHEAREGFDPVVKRSAELLAMQLDRFEDLLADLLEISRFDAGAAVLDADAADVREVVVRAVEHAATLAERRGSWLSVALPAGPCVADIDPRRVERVLRNLLVNAVEHAEGSDVVVTVAADDQAVAVGVRDHGIGMTAQEAQHVFDRFWRADPARARTTGGTGLGLAIAVEDAHLHGGRLEAWGRPGRGAHFVLTLPRRAGIRLGLSPLPLEPEDDSTPAPPAAAPGSGGPDPAALPALLADDARADAQADARADARTDAR